MEKEKTERELKELLGNAKIRSKKAVKGMQKVSDDLKLDGYQCLKPGCGCVFGVDDLGSYWW